MSMHLKFGLNDLEKLEIEKAGKSGGHWITKNGKHILVGFAREGETHSQQTLEDMGYVKQKPHWLDEPGHTRFEKKHDEGEHSVERNNETGKIFHESGTLPKEPKVELKGEGKNPFGSKKLSESEAKKHLNKILKDESKNDPAVNGDLDASVNYTGRKAHNDKYANLLAHLHSVAPDKMKPDIEMHHRQVSNQATE